MTTEEMKNEFYALYNLMANSGKVENMRVFGMVHKQMFDWFVQNKPDLAQDWLGKLESIKWNNYLTPKEADAIVEKMIPEAPWKREQWKGAMDKHGFAMSEEPYYNSCALFATMSMIMSDSSKTIADYIDGEDTFKFVHALALDKLKDKDKKFNIREYFDV